MRSVGSNLSAAARQEIGTKNKMLDQLKAGLEKEGFSVLGSASESDSVGWTWVTGNGSDAQKIFRHENGARTDMTDVILKAGTPGIGSAQSASLGIDGRNMFTRGAKSARVTGSYTDGQGKPQTTQTLVSLLSAFQMQQGKVTWVPTFTDPAQRDSIAQRLSYKFGPDARVRSVGDDGSGHLIVTVFNKKTLAYKRLVVTPSDGPIVQYKTAESNRISDAKELVRAVERERGHRDIRSIDFVKPTDSGDGIILKVNYRTPGKNPRQFEVDFGHPLKPSDKDLVSYYADGDYKQVTDRHTLQLVEKAVDQILGNHDWVHEAHRIPGLTSENSTTIVAYGRNDWGSNAQKISVSVVAIDAANRQLKSQWNSDDKKQVIDYSQQVLAAVTAMTGQPAFLGSHLSNRPADSLKEKNTELPIVTHNGNIRVHSAGKDFVVNMQLLLSGAKDGLVGPDTSKKSLRVGTEVADAAPTPAPAVAPAA